MATVSLVAGCSVMSAAAPAPASPAEGPTDAPTRDVAVTVTASCNGDPPTEYGFVLTVPTSVRAGRPFPVVIDVGDGGAPSGLVGYVGLSVGGTAQSAVTLALGGRTHLVPTWAPQQDLTFAVTSFGTFDEWAWILNRCVVDAPTEAVRVPVRHATPFAAAQITAYHRVTVICTTFPGGYPWPSVQDVGVAVPNQVRAGEPFPIESVGPVHLSGGVRSGQTVTPTGAVGETVDFYSYESSIQYAPPPYPPVPIRICEQEGGVIHLASVPIVG